MIKAILFDFGNTLVRHDNLDWKKLERAGLYNHAGFFEKRGIRHVSLKAWSEWFTRFYAEQEAFAKKHLVEIDVYRIFRSLIEAFHLPADVTPEALAAMYYQPICQSRILFDDVRETLKKIQSQKRHCGIISNSVIPGSMVRSVLAQLGILEYLDVVLISSEIGYRKPHPRMFEIAATRLALKPKEMMLVGDHPEDDIAGAKKSGWTAVWLNRTGQKLTGRIKPDMTLSSLNALPVDTVRVVKKAK